MSEPDGQNNPRAAQAMRDAAAARRAEALILHNTTTLQAFITLSPPFRCPSAGRSVASAVWS